MHSFLEPDLAPLVQLVGRIIWTMKVLEVTVLVTTFLTIWGCDPHFDACNANADITTIVCQSGTCHLEPENVELNYLVDDLTKLDPDVCRMKCKEQKDTVDDPAEGEEPLPKCQFFRFEKVKITTNSLNKMDVIRAIHQSKNAFSKQSVEQGINTVGSQSVGQGSLGAMTRVTRSKTALYQHQQLGALTSSM